METRLVNNPPITYAQSGKVPQVTAEIGVERQAMRYLFCVGDHVVPGDKHQLASIGAWAGGYFLGTSEFPTAWRTNYFLIRGAMTPFEKKAELAFADQEITQQMKDRRVSVRGGFAADAYYEVFPGDDMALALSDDYRYLGFVEIESLRDAEWDMHAPLELQVHFFPDWFDWLKAEKPIPGLLADWEGLIVEGIAGAETPAQRTAGEQMMESARVFREYAQNLIGTNRELVRKGANDAQFSIGWSNTARLFAEQLNIELEPEAQVRTIAQGQVEAQASTNKNIEMLVAEMAKDRQLATESAQTQTELMRLLAERIPGQVLTVPEARDTVAKAKADVIASIKEPDGNLDTGTRE